MRRLVIRLIALGALAASPALAQGSAAGNWIGGGVQLGGLPTLFPFGVTIHYGLDDLIGRGVDLRPGATVSFGGFGVGVGVGADALVELPVGGEALKVYAGGGLELQLVIGNATVPGFNAGVLAGAEVRFDEIGVYGEVDLGFGVLGGLAGFVPAFRVGASYPLN